MTFKEFYNTFAGTANQTFDVACLRERAEYTINSSMSHGFDDIAEKEVGLWYVVSGTLNIRVYVK